MKQTIFKLVAVLALAGSLAACKKEVSPYADEAVPTVTLSSPVSTFTQDKANVVLELSHFIHKDVNVTFEVTGIEAEAVDFPMEYVIEAGALKKTIPIAIDEELASLGDKTVAISIAKVENAVVASSAPVNIGINIEDVAMVNVSDRLRSEGLKGRLILQVHDELIVECPEAETERVKAILREEMEGVARFSVPLTCETKAGKNWAEAH
jgi:hypothetical protein